MPRAPPTFEKRPCTVPHQVPRLPSLIEWSRTQEDVNYEVNYNGAISFIGDFNC
jgi:hypothetical protein